VNLSVSIASLIQKIYGEKRRRSGGKALGNLNPYSMVVTNKGTLALALKKEDVFDMEIEGTYGSNDTDNEEELVERLKKMKIWKVRGYMEAVLQVCHQ
jgi:hypothetical protein